METNICPYCGKPVIDKDEDFPTSPESAVRDDDDRLWHFGCVEKAGEEQLKRMSPEEYEKTW